MSASEEQGAKWGKWRVLSYVLLICGTYLLTQMAVIFVVVGAEAASNPDLDAGAWSANAANSGLALAICTIAAAIACVPLIGFLTGRREGSPWTYLGVRAFRWQSLLLWCALMLVFLACTDLVSLALDRPLVPKFMIDAYESARYPLLLAIALLVAAPVLEELFFRGFLISTLGSLGVPFRVAATLSALCWAAIHGQYDLYEMSQIFLMGLLFAEARYRSGSLLASVAMHSVTNALALIETILLSGGG